MGVWDVMVALAREDGYELTNDAAVISLIVLFSFLLLLTVMQCCLRMKIRGQRKIEGSACEDFCTVFCCMACSQCQMTNEYVEEQKMQLFNPFHYPGLKGDGENVELKI